MSGPVLLVHDDIGTIAAVRRVLTRAGHEVVLATSAADAMIAFGHHLPSLIVLGPAVESGRGREVLEELSQHPNGAETRVLLLGEEVAGYAYPVVPLPLDGASFLELFESALQAPAYTQAAAPVPSSLEDTLFGDLPVEEQSTEQRAHAAVEFALEQAHQEFEAEAVADLDASLARTDAAEGAEPEWDPFGGSGAESGEAFESPPADGDDELAALENEVREEAARRRQARLSLQQVAQLGEEPASSPGTEPAPLPASDPDLDFGDMGSGEPFAPTFAPPAVDAVALEEEQTRVRRAALLQAQREAKEARIRLAELREERAGDGASIQLESDALLHQKQKEWAEREERIRRNETHRQESLKQAMAEAEAARELSAQVGLKAEEAEAARQEAAFAEAEAEAEAGAPSVDEAAPFQEAKSQPFDELSDPELGGAASPSPDALGEAAAEQQPDGEVASFADAAADPDTFGETGYEPQLPDEQTHSFADAGAEPDALEATGSEPQPIEQAASFAGDGEFDAVGEPGAEPEPDEQAASFANAWDDPEAIEAAGATEPDLVGDSASFVETDSEPDLVGESASFVEAATEPDLVGESASFVEAVTEPDLVGESASFVEAVTEPDLVGESASFVEAATEPDLVGESASFVEADSELDLVGEAESFSGSEQPVASSLEISAEEAHHLAALEISAAIEEEVQPPAEVDDWAEAEPDDGAMDLTGQDSAIGPADAASDDFRTQRASAEALAVTQAQTVEQEEVAAARAEQVFQTVSARGQVASAAAARALAMAREAQQEAEDEAQRLAEAAQREREGEAEAKRQLIEQTRRTVELEAQAQREREERERTEVELLAKAQREREERERTAAELLAQAQRERQERDRLAEELRAQAQREREERERIAAELLAQTERERQERLRLEAEAEARATREREEGLRLAREKEAAARTAQAEKERLAEELRIREEGARLERETRDQEARILAEHARQEREARERLEQQLQTQLEQERVERERVAQELEAAREAARASEERARSALLQVDEERHGREESEQSRRHAEADAEKARAEAREMAARAEAALVAIPKERGIIDRVPRTGIAPLEKLAELIRELTSARVDVRLELKADDALRVLWLRAGGIAGALSTASGETLLDRARQDGLIDPTQLRKLSPYKDRPASDQLSVLRENGLLRESEVIPLVQRYTEAVALAAFSEAGSLYRLATEAIPADVPLAASTRPVIHLLAEGLRRGADPASVLSTLGGLRAIPVRKRSELEPGRLELGERERRLLESVDGVATIESLLLGSGVRQDTALRVLVVARALGMLELMPAADSTPSEPLPELEVQRLNAKLSEIREADYFTVLGVPRSAGKDEVLRAYELLSTEFHPLRFSTHPDPGVPRRAEELQSFLSEAVTALGDDRLRGQYARNLAD
ncbi:MAG: hypothetical protein M3Y59_02420 [Myxococcota bacterium]|nr:hypothetical protein [Myxococcota bacterium]